MCVSAVASFALNVDQKINTQQSFPLQLFSFFGGKDMSDHESDHESDRESDREDLLAKMAKQRQQHSHTNFKRREGPADAVRFL